MNSTQVDDLQEILSENERELHLGLQHHLQCFWGNVMIYFCSLAEFS
jgi:hypothetical protein